MRLYFIIIVMNWIKTMLIITVAIGLNCLEFKDFFIRYFGVDATGNKFENSDIISHLSTLKFLFDFTKENKQLKIFEISEKHSNNLKELERNEIKYTEVERLKPEAKMLLTLEQHEKDFVDAEYIYLKNLNKIIFDEKFSYSNLVKIFKNKNSIITKFLEDNELKSYFDSLTDNNVDEIPFKEAEKNVI